MSSKHYDSENPNSLATHVPLEDSSSSSFGSSSISLSADSPQQSADRIKQSTKALKTFVGKPTLIHMASSSRPAKDSSSEDEPGAKSMVPYDQAHYKYTTIIED